MAEAGGIGGIDYDSREIGDEPMGHIVENKVIRHALLGVIKDAPNVDLMAPFKVADIEQTTLSIDPACVEATATPTCQLLLRAQALPPFVPNT